MKNLLKKVLTGLTPILGAGAIGVCPLCWIGSASLLTYLGLGALIPVWRWLAFGLIGIGAIGFILDYRSHRNPYPLALLSLGTVLLYVGRYVFLSTWGAWWIWAPGALLIIGAVIYNKYLFRKPLASPKPTA
ncbi:MAG: MerC domain-containing protein [Candidatus Taylorbacteria bacterium]|nr:MerC domain-containing protein [Candidatus Taylorbacteria bacterium]